MDLANTPSTSCQKCNSLTMRFDIKSQMFKCFNNKCGFIDSLTIISYDDEAIFPNGGGCQTITQQRNNKRYAFGSYENLQLNKLKDIDDDKNPRQKKVQDYQQQEINDVEDRIRNEVNNCKKLIRKWCDFMDDKKIEFEIVQHFLEIVNIDGYCTVPSVKRKAAGSFCFIIMKYAGNQLDLEEIAEKTNVPFVDIIREQEKIKQIKFHHKRIENEIPNQLLNSEGPLQSEWEKICFEYAQKVIFYHSKQQERILFIDKKSSTVSKSYFCFKDVKLTDYMEIDELNVFSLMEQNIKKLNPTKMKYEKNKVSAGIVFAFCLLTNIKELSISSPMQLSAAINLQEKSIVKYYKIYIYPKKEDIIPKQDIWRRRKNLNFILPFQ